MPKARPDEFFDQSAGNQHRDIVPASAYYGEGGFCVLELSYKLTVGHIGKAANVYRHSWPEVLFDGLFQRCYLALSFGHQRCFEGFFKRFSQFSVASGAFFSMPAYRQLSSPFLSCQSPLLGCLRVLLRHIHYARRGPGVRGAVSLAFPIVL